MHNQSEAGITGLSGEDAREPLAQGQLAPTRILGKQLYHPDDHLALSGNFTNFLLLITSLHFNCANDYKYCLVCHGQDKLEVKTGTPFWVLRLLLDVCLKQHNRQPLHVPPAAHKACLLFSSCSPEPSDSAETLETFKRILRFWR
jgi:hypothetical protein